MLLHRLLTLARFLFWTAFIIGAGALLGALSFPLLGPLFGARRPAAELALAGAKNIGFLALVWAPGAALVICIMHAYKARHDKPPADPKR